MSEAKEKWVDDLLGKMNLEQKVGQLLVLGFCGPVITPDQVELIKKYHLGGLRICQKFRTMNIFHDVKPGAEPDPQVMKSMRFPKGLCRDYAYMADCTSCTAKEYAEVLNQLRDYSLERELGIPIHFTIDQEGSGSDDFLINQRFFPHPMGYVASGEPELAYKAALCIGKQTRSIGANMIHSPVLDVNTNPKNPEIGTRAYSDKTDDTITYALQTFKGFQEAGLIATGKHFAGRGESESDAHYSLPSVNIDRETLTNVHLATFKALIDAGIPAIMIAHCLYPSLGESVEPSSTSKIIVQDVLRGELGFKGVITTDNTMMGGLLMKYEMSEAIVRTLIAGCDLALCRDESPIRYDIIAAILEAVKSGRYPESQVDESVKRILEMRWDMGLAENGGKVDVSKAGEPFNDPFVVKTATEAAEKTVLLMRDDANNLPLKPEQKVLLIEQIFPTHEVANNMYCHPGLLWEEMCKVSDNVGSVEIGYRPTENDKARIIRRLDEADVIVMTNYYYHKAASAITDLVKEIQKCGKPMVVVTNTPYPVAADAKFPTVVVSFSPGGREQLKAVSEVLYGRLKPTAKIPVDI